MHCAFGLTVMMAVLSAEKLVLFRKVDFTYVYDQTDVVYSVLHIIKSLI